MNEKKGKQSIKFGNPPYILGAAAVAGPKEIDGPMARYFDRVSEDATFGKDSWEEGESEMVRQAVTLAIQKAGIVKQDIRYIFAGDLLGQLIASTFGIKDMEIEKIGPSFEVHEKFPDRTNTEFVEIVDRGPVNMRVWERGSGETLACGTGACATAVACILNGLTDDEVRVTLLGGDLLIRWDREKDTVFMTGPAAEVFHGEI